MVRSNSNEKEQERAADLEAADAGADKGADRASKLRALVGTDDPAQQEKKLRELAQRAGGILSQKNPSKEDAELMRKMLDILPSVQRQVGNVSWQARERLIGDMSANAVVEESIRNEVTRIEEEMGYKDAPMLEKLLIRQIGVCWLALYQAQQIHTRAMSGSLSVEQANWYERRLTAAHARFLKAVETLAKVRKLSKVTPVQINMAQQQVNIAKAEG